MSKPFKVPLDEKGNQLVCVMYPSGSEVDPWEFKANLTYIGYMRGRSALNIKWKDTKTKRTYVSSMNLLDEALLEGHVNFDTIIGTFGFYKQGTSVLLKVIEWA